MKKKNGTQILPMILLIVHINFIGYCEEGTCMKHNDDD